MCIFVAVLQEIDRIRQRSNREDSGGTPEGRKEAYKNKIKEALTMMPLSVSSSHIDTRAHTHTHTHTHTHSHTHSHTHTLTHTLTHTHIHKDCR